MPAKSTLVYSRLPTQIEIGYSTEQYSRLKTFDISEMLDDLPGGTPSLIALRPKETEAYVVPAENLTLSGTSLTWEVTGTDTAVSGKGACQIMLTDGSDPTKVLLSQIITVIVNPSIVPGEEEAPEPVEAWLASAQAILAQVESAVESAGKLDGIDATASPSATASATLTTVNGHYRIVLGLPKGDKGDTGATWKTFIRYASVLPTTNSDMDTTPRNWIGVYSGSASSAPTSYTSYTWSQIKGDKGDTGSTGGTGPQGATGNGIASVAKTGASGLVDTYTITYTNGTTSTFTVTNGAKGDTGSQGPAGSLTSAGATATLEAQNWSGTPLTQTVPVQNVAANSNVIIAPAPASRGVYAAAGIACTAQSLGYLTFTADSQPSADVTVNLLIL